MLRILDDMQMRGNVMACTIIQLILFNGRKFDDEFPEFGKESRNIRLGLATNGMNPFGNMSTN